MQFFREELPILRVKAKGSQKDIAELIGEFQGKLIAQLKLEKEL